MDLTVVPIVKPEATNFIFGQSHFIKTVEDLHEALVGAVPGIRFCAFGHLGDGNLHYNVSQPIGADTADYLARWHEVNAVVFEIVLRMGGSISAEHGLGAMKGHEALRYKSPVEVAALRAVRDALDPRRIMNPRALF